MHDISEPDDPSASASLLDRFRAGDEAAFRLLVDRHERLVRGRLERRLPASLQRRVSVADVFQEACLVAFRRRGDFEDRGSRAFGNWLLGIADLRLRREIDCHANAAKRAVDREVTRSGRPETAYLRHAPGSPSRAVMSSEDVARVRAAMGELTADQRNVLRLALEHGLTLGEVAERTGHTREAVKKIYARSLRRLRGMVGGAGR